MENTENSIAVQVVQTPASPIAVNVPVNGTVADAIEAAGFDPSGQQVRVDGTLVTDLNTSINGVRRIILARQIKGNR